MKRLKANHVVSSSARHKQKIGSELAAEVDDHQALQPILKAGNCQRRTCKDIVIAHPPKSEFVVIH